MRITIVFTVFVLSFVLGSENTISADEPIIFKLRYSFFWKMCANWSTTMSKSDYSTEYELVKYTDYVDRFKDFVKKYPTVTIEATCRADSDLWDNPDCSKYYWEFETMNFGKTTNEYTNQDLVTPWKNGFMFDVGAQIGFGFKIKDDTLYLRPYVNGWVYKAGAGWSCLDFGLGAYKITFNPEGSNSNKEVIHPVVIIEAKENEPPLSSKYVGAERDFYVVIAPQQ